MRSQGRSPTPQSSSELSSLLPLLCAVVQRFFSWTLYYDFLSLSLVKSQIPSQKGKMTRKECQGSSHSVTDGNDCHKNESKVRERERERERERGLFRQCPQAEIYFAFSKNSPFSWIKGHLMWEGHVAYCHFLAVVQVTMHLLLKTWSRVRAPEREEWVGDGWQEV